MDIEELEPAKKQPPKKDLEVLSIEALHEYIGELEAEIARTRDAITLKQSAREGAESFFKR